MTVRTGRLTLIVTCGVSMCLITSSSVVAHEAAGSRMPLLTHIVMNNAAVGWGTTPTRVLKTVDGGRTWHTLLSIRRPASSGNGPDFAFASISSQTAWAVRPSTQGLRTFRTANGGATWTYTHQSFAGSKRTPVEGQLVFADRQHGWLLLHDGAAAGSAPQAILRTSNGGRTWRRVEFDYLDGHPSPHGLPPCTGAAGNLSFLNAATGWATGICGAATQWEEVFQTQDGGRTWRQVVVSTPDSKLVYFGPGQVTVARLHKTLLLPVSLDSPPAFILYRSINGGLTWKPTHTIHVASPYADLGPPFSFAAFSDRIAWVLMGRALRRTTDGGTRWYVLNKYSHLVAPAEIDFVTKQDGFALNTMVGGKYLLFVTRDSGRHWRRIAVRWS